MGKHGSSCRGTQPLQGILLVLVMLAASFDAGRASSESAVVEGVAEGLQKIGQKAVEKIVPKRWKPFQKGFKTGTKVNKYWNKYAPGSTVVWVDTVRVSRGSALPVATLPVATADITATAAAQAGSCAPGLGVYRLVPIRLFGNQGTKKVMNLSRARFLECPAGGTSAVLGLGWGGDLVPRFVTSFSYWVGQGPGGNVYTIATLGPAEPGGAKRRSTTPLILGNPGSTYNVRITGILVGGQNIMLPLGTSVVAYPSTTDPLTHLERGVYFSLKAELERILSTNRVTPAPPLPLQHPDQLCYLRTAKLAAVQFPSVAVVFDRADAVMQVSVANLLQSVAQYDCLSIVPTNSDGEVSVLGGLLQSGRTMTIQVVPGGLMTGTLTFDTTTAV